jgi:hypothetical protein
MALAPASVIARIPPAARQRISTATGAAESAALGALAPRLMRPIVTAEDAAPLIAAGYVRQTFGGYSLTDLGSLRAAMEAPQ